LPERFRISPWAVVALAALVAAFCGNALAGSQATQSAKPFTAKKAKRLFTRLIDRRAAALSVASAADAGTVGGLQVKELAFTGGAGTVGSEIFNASGISISVDCPADVAQGPEVSATPTGTADGALKFIGRGFFPGNAVAVDRFEFNAGDPAADLDSGEDRGAAQLSFLREDGATVNGVISWEDGVRTAEDLCGVSGALIAG